MTPHKIVPDDSLGHPFGGQRESDDLRTASPEMGRTASMANQRTPKAPRPAEITTPALWGTRHRRIDWRFVAFCVVWAIGFGVLLYLGLERGGR